MTSSPLGSSAPALNRFRSRGLALSAAAAAGCVLASVAEAQIVYSGTKNIASSATQKIDFNADGTADITFYSNKGPYLNAYGEATPGSETGEVVLTAAGTGNPGTVANLTAGTLISSASPFSTGHFTNSGQGPKFGLSGGTWTNGDTGYIGFSFVSGGSTYYGWAEVLPTSLGSAGSGSTGTMVDWAYNSTAGASILAGQTAIPEPATTALGAGAVALAGALWLKRRLRRRAGARSAATGRSPAPAANA